MENVCDDVCSVAGAVYDVLGYVHPFMGAPHDGMKFSTPDVDWDLHVILNCGEIYGGGWWYTKCALWIPTGITNSPAWYSLADTTFYNMKNIHIMIKQQ